MLHDAIAPDRYVQTDELGQVRELLEADFKTEYRHTTLDKLNVRADGQVEVEGLAVPYQQSFLEACSRAIEMELPYAYRVDFGLFKYNFDARKQICTRGILVCLHRNVAVNIAGADYRPAVTTDILGAIDIDEKFWNFKRARLSDQGIELDYVSTSLTAIPEPGDIIQMGVHIHNSETGFRQLKGSLFAFRLVCANGAVMSDEMGAARWNYYRRVTYPASVAKFQKDLRGVLGGQERVIRLYEESVHRNLLDTEFCRLWRRLRGYLPAEEVDAILSIPTDERQNVQGMVRERPASAPAQSTPWRAYDIHNRITAAAQRLGFHQRNRLEYIGGDLLAQAA